MKRIFGITFKELLFAYLAITKVFYWVNTLNAIPQGEMQEVLLAVANRMIGQDIMVVVILLLMGALDTYIENHPELRSQITRRLLVYGIGYIIYVISIIVYSVLVGVIFGGLENLRDSFFFALEILPMTSVIFFVASFVLSLKERMKKTEALLYLPEADSPEARINMLDKLCACGVLSEEECERKKELCYSTPNPD